MVVGDKMQEEMSKQKHVYQIPSLDACCVNIIWMYYEISSLFFKKNFILIYLPKNI